MPESLLVIGAWMTDIDDTLIDSGVTPDDNSVGRIGEFIERLAGSSVAWVGMSGVSLEKIRSRFFDRLPRRLLSNVIYYSGDGSQKFSYDDASGAWREDHRFARTFTDEQGVALLGEDRYRRALLDLGIENEKAERRVSGALAGVRKTASNGVRPVLAVLEAELADAGFAPSDAALYYRGGSISWMIVGDRSAAAYRETRVAMARERLIERAREELDARNRLEELGPRVVIPFPGARGIKLVLEENTKLRAANDFFRTTGVLPRRTVFCGNELYEGGNDNMLRAVKGLTLLSLGDRVDRTGPSVVDGRIGKRRRERSRPEGEQPGGNYSRVYDGPRAMDSWMSWISARLRGGETWDEVVDGLRGGERPG